MGAVPNLIVGGFVIILIDNFDPITDKNDLISSGIFPKTVAKLFLGYFSTPKVTFGRVCNAHPHPSHSPHPRWIRPYCSLP